MDSTTGAVIASSVMVSTTTLLATGLFWVSASWVRERRSAADRVAAQQLELRAEVAELCQRVGAVQRLLEGVD